MQNMTKKQYDGKYVRKYPANLSSQTLLMSFWTIANGEENNNQIIGLMQKLQNDNGDANLEFASKYTW